MADDVALELRQSFSSTLTRIGDYYWSAEYGKTFALDYYMHAYMLDPANDRAKERASLTPGELRQAADKAKNSTYTRTELIAAEPLNALAARSVKDRLKALRDIKKRSRRRSFSSQQRLDLMTSVTEEMAKTQKPGSEANKAGEPEKDFAESLPKPSSALVKRIETLQTAPAKPPIKPIDTKRPARVAKPSKPSASEITDFRKSSISASEGARAVLQGRALLEKAKFEEAAQAFHRALKANRRNSAALMGLSDTYFELGQYRKAVDYGERAIAVNPRTASYRWKLGDAYVRVLRYDDAAKQYKKGGQLGSRKAKRRLKALRKKLGEKRR